MPDKLSTTHLNYKCRRSLEIYNPTYEARVEFIGNNIRVVEKIKNYKQTSSNPQIDTYLFLGGFSNKGYTH